MKWIENQNTDFVFINVNARLYATVVCSQDLRLRKQACRVNKCEMILARWNKVHFSQITSGHRTAQKLADSVSFFPHLHPLVLFFPCLCCVYYIFSHSPSVSLTSSFFVLIPLDPAISHHTVCHSPPIFSLLSHFSHFPFLSWHSWNMEPISIS